MSANPKTTAIIIIHGIGQQAPFETLDSFCRGLIVSLGLKVKDIEHCLAPFQNNKGDRFTDSFIRINLKSPINDGVTRIDIFEYYWANLTERKITTSEISEWINDTLKGAKTLYKNTPELKNITAQSKGKYWHKLSSLANWGMIVFRILKFFLALIPSWEILRGLRNFIEKKAAFIIIGYVGDVAIYTSMDVKSKNYNTRSAILKGSMTLLQNILKKKRYSNVIVAGHSLGSVIAYDTVNKTNIATSLSKTTKKLSDKIKGLVTFGSPLDKIYFFFCQRYSNDLYIRGQIAEDLHSYRIKNRNAKWEKPVANPIEPTLNNVPWLNFYHKLDPVSGRLDFYDVNKNIGCEFKNKYDKWGVAHVGYWDYTPMYKEIETLI